MSQNLKNTIAFQRLKDEINASSGQLRYDPISSNLFMDLSDAEKEEIKISLLEKLKTNDERIVSFALKIDNFNVDDYVESELDKGARPVHWVISATYGLFLRTSNSKWLNSLIDLICDDSIPASTRRLAFSCASNEELDDDMKTRLAELYRTVTDKPLKIRLKQKLG